MADLVDRINRLAQEVRVQQDIALCVSRGRDATKNYCKCRPVVPRGITSLLQAVVERYETQDPQTIPRIIHQIWIGKEAPAAVVEWMATFQTWCSQNGFQYMLWDNSNIRNVVTENIALFDAEPQYCGKADVARLEILYKYGGIYMDSDMVNLGKDFGALIAASNPTGFFVGQEKENTRGLANSVIGSSRGNLIIYTLLKLQPAFFWGCPTAHPFERTGPLMFDHVLHGIFSHITIFPYYVFFPFFWGQAAYQPMTVAEYNTAYPLSFTVQYGYSTNNLGAKL